MMEEVKRGRELVRQEKKQEVEKKHETG